MFAPTVLSVVLLAGVASAKMCIPECVGNVCTLTAKVDVHAGELGYFTFEECGEESNPTIGMTIGKTYKFKQADSSNYYHPLGFAYYPDGAHDLVNELEPGITETGSDCEATLTCPAPMYYSGDTYLGKYSPDGGDLADQEDFGLDFYEPLFFYPLEAWSEEDDFSVDVTFDDATMTKDIFYFCHIHQYMSGRIKLMDADGKLLNEEDTPDIEYTYDSVSTYDEECGTFGISDYQLPHKECPEKFVCDVAANDPGLARFSGCIDTMNCNMAVGMTTHATSEIDLFLHQMIPHHQNAVNMAKALLKTGKVEGGDDLDYIAREIINGQNFQIQYMKKRLGVTYGTADCVVIMSDSSASSRMVWLSGLVSIAIGFALM